MPDLFKQIRSYFYYNRAERNGIFVLIIILMLIIIFNIILPYLSQDDPIDFSEFKAQIEEFEHSQKRAQDSIQQLYSKKNNKTKIPTTVLNPFYFNPNELPIKKWKELGLSDKQIKVIKNYEKSGGRFLKKKDLSKIYSISKEEYKILEPFILIDKPEYNFSKSKKENLVLTPCPFDPNTTTYNQWISFGLDSQLVNIIVNYQNKGGLFEQTEDIKKIYGMTEEIYSQLEPFVKIISDTNQGARLKAETKNLFIELNSADSLDLQLLAGIGPSYSKRIIKYRELLGGYYNKEQLLEVYGFDSLKLSRITDKISIDTIFIQKININEATIKEMIRHPYIEFYLAKSIIELRSEKEIFSNIMEIQQAQLINNEIYKKISPYLSTKN